MGMPFFSFVTPAYNASKWIPRCIDSIINCGLNNADYELRIIDDGSTDKTLSIVSDYASRYPQIVVKARENRGYDETMNELLQAARGEYLISVDSDNWIVGNIVSLKERLLDKRQPPIDIVQFGTSDIFSVQLKTHPFYWKTEVKSTER